MILSFFTRDPTPIYSDSETIHSDFDHSTCFYDKIMIKQRYKGGGIMINIRPVSDLRNNIKQYSALTDDIEHKLDEADKSDVRYSASFIFILARTPSAPPVSAISWTWKEWPVPWENNHLASTSYASRFFLMRSFDSAIISSSDAEWATQKKFRFASVMETGFSVFTFINSTSCLIDDFIIYYK